MTLREFGRLGGEDWDQPFRAKLGKAAAKLYRKIYKKDPPKTRDPVDWRNKVGKYPCGILEQAYRQLRAEGIPLVRPVSEEVLMRRRLQEERKKSHDPERDAMVRARLRAAQAKTRSAT